MRVAVVGHVEWVDFVAVPRLPEPGEVLHARGSFTRAAGGGGVVASVLPGLGAEVDFFCALGRDAPGEAAAAQLRERGVHLHVAWREEPTRRAVTFLHPPHERTIVTIGERLEPRGEDELPWRRLAGARAVYFTAGDPRALAHAREAPVLVASPRARHALAAEAGPVLDALVYSANDADESAWAQRLAGRARLMVATDGANGGRWWPGEPPAGAARASTQAPGSPSEGPPAGRWHAAELPGPREDSYGCGDSFAAGFTFALGCGQGVAAAVALGAECGARALTCAGAP
jgi:ribokinase